ncbi:M20/M25/M40 family metallo-hydrolase (plasmid) [Embleya sp. NBC_00888]|uniref:M20/M25/M40 family metallo-hydrolase n=1 Tax=Embleya sp. NBC_00888 TaxID=2975960 RepID=UPI002F917522|nr:M20/M25/M40 family metallo-hydrolase [Embleya sp. NBC_00888]
MRPRLSDRLSIADRSGGDRAHGSSGFRQSLTYVKGVLDKAGFRTSLRPFMYDGALGYNLVADRPGGDPNHVVLVGAHLDSVAAGPGMNDNGSGAAAVLASAVAMSRAGVAPERRVRFAWWGAEEQGLIGSKDYVGKLSAAERKKIDVYLDFDMTGTKDVRQWLVVEPRWLIVRPARSRVERLRAGLRHGCEGVLALDCRGALADVDAAGEAGFVILGPGAGTSARCRRRRSRTWCPWC